MRFVFCAGFDLTTAGTEVREPSLATDGLARSESKPAPKNCVCCNYWYVCIVVS